MKAVLELEFYHAVDLRMIKSLDARLVSGPPYKCLWTVRYHLRLNYLRAENSKTQPEIERFAKRVKVCIKYSIGISPGFWLTREGNGISNIGLPGNFQDHTINIFFSKWRLLIFSAHTRHLWRLTLTPPPCSPSRFFFLIFFIKQMTAKDVSLYFRLPRWLRSLFLFLERQGKIL